MTLPVLVGPSRCELIYSQDRQPLIELSLRVSLPVVELLRTLSQVAPPTDVHPVQPQRPPAKAPAGKVHGHCTAGAFSGTSSGPSQSPWAGQWMGHSRDN